MTVTKVPKGLSVTWKPTIDSDIRISGVLADKGAGVFSGTVDFSSGDEQGKKEALTLRFDPVGPTLSLELKTMWEEPLTFRPAR